MLISPDPERGPFLLVPHDELEGVVQRLLDHHVVFEPEEETNTCNAEMAYALLRFPRDADVAALEAILAGTLRA